MWTLRRIIKIIEIHFLVRDIIGHVNPGSTIGAWFNLRWIRVSTERANVLILCMHGQSFQKSECRYLRHRSSIWASWASRFRPGPDFYFAETIVARTIIHSQRDGEDGLRWKETKTSVLRRRVHARSSSRNQSPKIVLIMRVAQPRPQHAGLCSSM